uniref:Sec23/Sec24 trunk domain-containing protein n=1 Tax=Fagus sylvatica TaxID=28930 RepID=A0A2N9IA56_FAGSY
MVVDAKYGSLWGGWCSTIGRGPYGVSLWKAIRNEWDKFSLHCSFVVGDGRKVMFWQDLWCGDMPLKEAFPELFLISREKDAFVADLLSFPNDIIYWDFHFTRRSTLLEACSSGGLYCQMLLSMFESPVSLEFPLEKYLEGKGASLCCFPPCVAFFSWTAMLGRILTLNLIIYESVISLLWIGVVCVNMFWGELGAAGPCVYGLLGRVILRASTDVLPSTGIGSLSAREAEGRTNISAGEKEAHKLLQPADKTLKTMAIEFAEYQVCVDVFITTQTYVDMGSISVIPRTTGGQVYYYYPFSALSDPVKLYNDLRWNVTRPQGFEAVMRVRCSQGIQVQEYHGNFCKRIPTDVDLPGIDCDKTIMVTLKHDDKLQDGSECLFQRQVKFLPLHSCKSGNK